MSKKLLPLNIRCIASVVCLLSLSFIFMAFPVSAAPSKAPSSIPRPSVQSATSGSSALDRCLSGRNYSPNSTGANYISPSIQVDGAGHTDWTGRYGIYDSDVFWIIGDGSTRIDWWGTHKGANGDPGAAGPGPWPSWDANPYALLVGIAPGGDPAYLEDYSTGRIATVGDWIQAGSKSDCIVIHAGLDPQLRDLQHEHQKLRTSLRFMINDSNLGDNAGGPIATVYQYW